MSILSPHFLSISLLTPNEVEFELFFYTTPTKMDFTQVQRRGK